MLSPVTFVNYQILRIEYCQHPADLDEPIDGVIPDPELEIKVNPDNKNEFVVKLISRILPEKDKERQNCPIELEIELLGHFELQGEMEDDERNFHLGVSAPSMLYGVIRSWVSQITAHSGYHSIMMPSVQFANLGNEDKKEEES